MTSQARRRGTVSGIIVLAFALVVQVVAAVAASPVSAAATCTMQANLPARIVIDRSSVITRVTVSGCAGFWSASVSLAGPDGFADFLWFYGTRSVNLTTWYWDALGTYRTYDGSGYFPGFTGPNILWHNTSTVIKLGTRTALAVSRSRSTVKFTAAVTRYEHDSYGFVGYANRVVSVEQSASAGGPWSLLTRVRADSSGRVSITRQVATPRFFRATVGDAGSYFGSTSAVRHG